LTRSPRAVWTNFANYASVLVLHPRPRFAFGWSRCISPITSYSRSKIFFLLVRGLLTPRFLPVGAFLTSSISNPKFSMPNFSIPPRLPHLWLKCYASLRFVTHRKPISSNVYGSCYAVTDPDIRHRPSSTPNHHREFMSPFRRLVRTTTDD
jgi:hypothetical protein